MYFSDKYFPFLSVNEIVIPHYVYHFVYYSIFQFSNIQLSSAHDIFQN